MWIFGYGSLIWKVGFDYVERREGYVEGWARRFWQDSTDHRGVPEAPGRVVTLIEEPGAQTWGAAYRIAPEDTDHILDRLDYREKGGYIRQRVPIHGPNGLVAPEALFYVGTPGNPNWGGPLPTPEIAEIIARSHGPSGSNREYLLELDRALREMGAVDEHVRDLARAVREI